MPAIGLNGPAIATVAQTVFSAAAVLWAVLGARGAARMLFAGLPAALGIAALAVGETEAVALAVAALAGLISAGLGAQALRADRGAAPA